MKLGSESTTVTYLGGIFGLPNNDEICELWWLVQVVESKGNNCMRRVSLKL